MLWPTWLLLLNSENVPISSQVVGQRWQHTCGTKMKQLIVVVHTKMPPEVKPNSKLCQARKKR